MSILQLEKFEALGNDFLVLADAARSTPLDPEVARAVCDRRRGVGADGLIRLSGTRGQVAMELWNADGSVAETSGNGLRCAALAAVRQGARPDLVIETAAGAAHCQVRPEADGRAGEVRVEMGNATVTDEESPVPTRTAYRVNVGNPHLVLIGDAGDVAIAEIGAALEWAVEGGQNVELVTVKDRNTLDLDVYERGAGITEACGSGSAAAAAAAHLAGLVEETVHVRNPGGELLVELSGTPPAIALTGPARHVASVTYLFEEVGERS